MKDKKGNLNMIVPAVLVLILAAIILVFGLLMLDELYVNTGDTAGSTKNETLTTVSEAGETVANAGACAFNSFTVTDVRNYTDDVAIGSTNYTTNSRAGIIYAAAAGTFNNTDWLVNYTYKSSTSEACLATNSTLRGLGKFGDYFDLIVLAIVISVIISLLLVVFSMRKEQ